MEIKINNFIEFSTASREKFHYLGLNSFSDIIMDWDQIHLEDNLTDIIKEKLYENCLIKKKDNFVYDLDGICEEDLADDKIFIVTLDTDLRNFIKKIDDLTKEEIFDLVKYKMFGIRECKTDYGDWDDNITYYYDMVLYLNLIEQNQDD